MNIIEVNGIMELITSLYDRKILVLRQKNTFQDGALKQMIGQVKRWKARSVDFEGRIKGYSTREGTGRETYRDRWATLGPWATPLTLNQNSVTSLRPVCDTDVGSSSVGMFLSCSAY